MPTGILLMNLGGPESLGRVHDFLLRLFLDRDIIRLPFQKQMAKFIAWRRSPQIMEQYKAIGGGSPIRHWTDQQGKRLAHLLDQISPGTAPHKHYIAFRYAEPFTQDAINQMKTDGVRRAIAFPQYPQFSCTTTGSSLNELRRTLKNIDPGQLIAWSVIDRWSLHPSVLEAFASTIREALSSFPDEKRNKALILFTAHSLPLAVVERGDTYAAEVCATAHAVMKASGFKNPFRVVWQSQVGPAKWLSPQTRDAITMFAKRFKKDPQIYPGVVLVPIAFTSDHIETLYELDHEYIENIAENLIGCNKGIFVRAPALNTRPEFIHALANVVHEHLVHFERKHQSSNSLLSQYGITCHNCTEPACSESRSFFINHEQRINSL